MLAKDSWELFVRSMFLSSSPVFQARWRKLPAVGFLNRRESHVSPPWFVIQWTASLERWIYWRALCRGMKVGLYLGDAICGAAQLLMRGLERKAGRKKKKKHSYPFGVPVMKRDEKKGGRIRRAEAQSILWFFSFSRSVAPQFPTLAALQPSAVYYSRGAAVTLQHIPVCSHSSEEKFHLRPWEYVRPRGESESQTCLASHLASPPPGFACTVQSAACCWAVNVTEAFTEQEHILKMSTLRLGWPWKEVFLPCNYGHRCKTSVTV